MCSKKKQEERRDGGREEERRGKGRGQGGVTHSGFRQWSPGNLGGSGSGREWGCVRERKRGDDLTVDGKYFGEQKT